MNLYVVEQPQKGQNYLFLLQSYSQTVWYILLSIIHAEYIEV